MTNYEKHKDEIIEYIFINNMCKLKQELIGTDCSKVKSCSDCKKLAKEWLEAEYVAPEMDWSKVPMGTPVRAWNVANYVFEKTFVVYNEDEKQRFITLDTKDKTIGYWKNAELIEVDNERNC